MVRYILGGEDVDSELINQDEGYLTG
jgi:hypothetical protein